MEEAIPDGSWGLFRLFGDGAVPSATALDGKRVIVQLREEADPETGGQYTLKRWRVTKRNPRRRRRGDRTLARKPRLRAEAVRREGRGHSGAGGVPRSGGMIARCMPDRAQARLRIEGARSPRRFRVHEGCLFRKPG